MVAAAEEDLQPEEPRKNRAIWGACCRAY